MDTFVTHPETGGLFPAVFIFMDIWGIREELLDIARQIGIVGYCCLVPDWYRGEGTARMLQKRGSEEVALHLNERSQSELLDKGHQLSDATVVADTRAVVSQSQGRAPIRPGNMGAIGYCMGGRHVMCVASSLPQFTASACLHGTQLVSDAEDSPHHKAGNLRGEFYCGFGGRDSYTPPTLVERLNEVFKPLPARFSFQVHEGADHGYALRDRPAYERPAALRDWEQIFAMFHRQIPPCTSGVCGEEGIFV
jgi:carboxymethylenebutenolidase